MPAPDLSALRAFRTDLHGCFPRRADALFEVVDALLTADPVGLLPYLSVQAAHRRGWGSLSDALAEGALDAAALRGVLTRHAARHMIERGGDSLPDLRQRRHSRSRQF